MVLVILIIVIVIGVVMVAQVESIALVKQAGAAAFYGASSLLIIMVNKAVLTSYGSVSNYLRIKLNVLSTFNTHT